jgi:integrase
MQTNITTRTINAAKPEAKPYEIRDTGLKGLLLRVQPSGIMTYYVEYKRGKRFKIGRADAITPFQAREMGKAILSEAYKGDDPADKRKLSKTKTYLQFLEDEYQPWLKSNLKTGLATFECLKKSFVELYPLKLYEITPWHIEKWRSRRQKNGVKPSTINRELGALKACLARASEWGIIESHPIERVKPSKVDSNPKVRFLTGEERERIMGGLDKREQAIRADRASANKWRAERGYALHPDLSNTPFADYLKPVVLLSLNTGLRRGEVFGLRWEDIDFAQRLLTVTAATAKSGKTRHVPLNDEAFRVLKGWQKQTQKLSGLVFEGKTGKPFHDVRTAWKNTLKEAGVKDFRWHDLRHTFASNLTMAGVDLNTVRELLGHSDYKMTLRYAHLAPEHKAMAVSKLVKEVGA